VAGEKKGKKREKKKGISERPLDALKLGSAEKKKKKEEGGWKEGVPRTLISLPPL